MSDARRSILCVTSELPWPLNSGGHLRTFHLLRALAERYRIRLIAPVLPGQDAVSAALEDNGITVCPAPIAPRQRWREAARAARAAAAGEPYVFYRRHD